MERVKHHFLKALYENNEIILTRLLTAGFPINMRLDGLPLLHIAA